MQKIIRKSDDIILVLSEEEELFRNKFFLNDAGSHESLRCTICFKITYGKIYPHPALRVIVCFNCLNNYEKHEYLTFHNDDDIMCRWCTKSSMNYNCSKCTCLFCNECLDRNFGPNYIQDNWQCFICNPKQLWRLRAICTRAMDDRPKNKNTKSIKTNVDLDKNRLPQMAENSIVSESSPREDKKIGNETKVPQKCSTAACDMILEVKKDVDFFIHSFKTEFDKFYDRCSKLEYNTSYENVQRNNEKLSKFFDSAIENIEFLKSNNNMNFCKWQSQHLELLPIMKKTQQIEHLSESDSKQFNLKSNSKSFSKRKSLQQSDSSLCLQKKLKTENYADSFESQNTVNREHHSEPSNDSLDLLTQTNLSSLRNQKNDSTNLKDSQYKQFLHQEDQIDMSVVQSPENQTVNESISNQILDLHQLKNNKTLARSEESSVDDLQNGQTKSQEDQNFRSDQILDLITSDQFESLKNIQTLDDSQENQSSTGLQNVQIKSKENRNLQSSNQDSQNNLTKLQPSKIADSQNQTEKKTSHLQIESQVDAHSFQSSSIVTKPRFSQSNIQSSSSSDLLQFSEIKVEADEFDRASNGSVDTIILNGVEDYDNMITLQPILCEKSGTFYQGFSVGKDQVHLVMNANETGSENDTEGEEYADIIEKVLKQGGYVINAEEESSGETNESSQIKDEEKNEVGPENIKDENPSEIQIKSIQNLDDLQSTEDYQIALQQERFAEEHAQLTQPEPPKIVGIDLEPPNIKTDPDSQETTLGMNPEQVNPVQAGNEPHQCKTDQGQVDQDQEDTNQLDQDEADLVQMDRAQLDQKDQKEQDTIIIDFDKEQTEYDKKLEIAMADLDIDVIKLEDFSQETVNFDSPDKESLTNQLSSSDTNQLESDVYEIQFEESAGEVSDAEERKEAYNRLYYNTSDECNDLSLSDSSSSSPTHSSESSVSDILIDSRQKTLVSDNSSTNLSTKGHGISSQIKVDPKLLLQCRIQLVKSREDLQIERLINLKTLNKTIRLRCSSSDDSGIVKRKKIKTNTIEDCTDNDSLTSDCVISDDSDYTNNASNTGSISGSASPQVVSSDDSDEEFSHDLLEKEPVIKTKKATRIPNESYVLSDDEIDQDDPESKWRRDKLLRGALNNYDSDSTNDSVANTLLEKFGEKKHRKRTSSTCDPASDLQNSIAIYDTSESEAHSDDSDVQFIVPKNKSKGRHNIREVIPDSLLQAETQQADKEEADRKKRIDQKNKSLEVVLSQSAFNKDQPQLVLDWDNVLKEPLVSVDPLLIPILKTHQINGIKFMWDNCFESVARLKDSKGAGCILAHCMGLGKTMQVIVLAHTILTHPITNVKHILVLCPLTTVYNWCNEFKKTLKDVSDKLKIYFITPDRFKSFCRKVSEVRRWRKTGGVLIVSYDTFKSVIHSKRNIMESSAFLKEALLNPGPDLVVCDEGHILKSGKTNIFMSLVEVKTARRIILTGTPMQNNLKEYYYMVNFVKPSLLGTFREYTRCFINPIENGQFEDSSKADINLMRKRSHVLHKKLETTVQRYEVNELKPYLPKKNEHVLFLQLSSTQIKLYNLYLELRQNMSYKKMLFQDFHNLQHIWTHPAMLQLKLDKKEKDEKVKDSNDSTSKKYVTKDDITFPKDLEAEGPTSVPFDWFKDQVPDDLMTNLEHGPKMKLLFSIIKECEFIGEKLLVFSSSIIELDLIEHFLKETRMIEGQCWRKGNNYLRMDGAVMSDNRSLFCDWFNDKHKKIKLFLISHKVGGLGLNLVAASRVVLMDVSWNPAYDSQSVFRVYRFGQERECYIYRLVAMGTMEEVVYSRAVTKLAISCRVVDEQQISRHFKSDDLQRMYKLNLDFLEKRPTPTLPPDRLLAKLWVSHNPILHNFCDHEALLKNQTHEELNEEEMKTAWDEYHLEEESVRERARAMQDSLPSGSANIMPNGSSLLPGIPIRPNSSSINFPTNFPFRNNNPALNTSTTNANYNHTNQPKIYKNPIINLPISSSANAQYQLNNPQQSMHYIHSVPNTSRYSSTDGNIKQQLYNTLTNATNSNLTNAHHSKIYDTHPTTNLQNSIPRNWPGSARFSHINPANQHNSSNNDINPQFMHDQTQNIPSSIANLTPNNTEYNNTNPAKQLKRPRKVENNLTHRYKKPVQRSNSTNISEQNANIIDGNQPNFHDRLKQSLSKPKSAIKNGDHREPTRNPNDRQISYVSEGRRIQIGDGEIQVRRIIQEPDVEI